MNPANQQPRYAPNAILPWLAAVLLRHELPDCSWHMDVMIELHAGGELWTLRVPHDVDLQQVAAFEGEVLPLHRREYLSYEGSVRGGALGTVTRIWRGEGCIVHTAGRVRFSLRFAAGAVHFSGLIEKQPGPGEVVAVSFHREADRAGFGF